MHGEIEQNWRVQEYFDNNKAKGRPALHEVTTRVKRGRVRNTALYSFSPRMAMRTDIVIVFWELGTAVFLIRIWDWKFTINTKLDGALLMLFVNYSFFFLFFPELAAVEAEKLCALESPGHAHHPALPATPSHRLALLPYNKTAWSSGLFTNRNSPPVKTTKKRRTLGLWSSSTMTNLIGRLPTTSGDLQPGIGGGDDHELELLERQLFETKSTHHYRSAPNNLFPTYPRKRMGAASLMTLWANRGLLDEGPNEVTKRMLVGVDTRWDFNAFSFDRLTGGQNLATLCTYLFRDLGLLAHFRLDALVVWRFFATVERHYHATNPYHNGVHAADVTQAMACFIAEPALRQHLRPIEKMSAIIAAVGHDLDHPGLNEKFLIATSSHLAGLYNNSSVLENHHWRTCVALMHETGFAGSLNTSDRLECEDLIQTMVLATDISRQSDYLKQLGQYLDQAVLDLSQSVYRHFMLQIALKCADISNPCRTWNISRLWSYRACEEFYRQGDRERELNLPVTPFCDRNNISVAKVNSCF
jgi:hypothetical protein